LCGAIRYEIIEEPITLYACHCPDCQTASGSSFMLAMQIPINAIRITKGNPKSYQRSRSDGRKKNIIRCPQCLSAIYGAAIESPQYFTLYAGTLDNSGFLQPVGHMWVCNAQPWIKIPEGALIFEKDPPDMHFFEEAWKARATKNVLC